MKKILLSLTVLTVALSVSAAEKEAVTIVTPGNAGAVERGAAGELAAYLGRLYPQAQFVVAENRPAGGKAIVIALGGTGAESFSVSVNGDVATIAGADARGVVYGVYAILEKLGCGFYVSYDALPAPRTGPFTFDGWQMSDAPMVKDRVVFDWHNFLSGCSTWNLGDWQKWTAQARKMRFNGIMVHAYGNNPMVRFSFDGVDKPLGYLSTTRNGRDWSTNHVTDVRRLFGGSVFESAVFGAEAAQVPEEKRGEAAEKLMQQVFAHARSLGMNVVFANDVDTISANPQEIIRKLPESARFSTGKGSTWLVNPETAEGYQYYRAQVQSLMTAYPQITQLVVWFRNGGTPGMDVKLAEMPPSWQKEYQAAIQKNPDAAKFWQSVAIFGLSKIVAAYDRALKEIGRTDVELCTGTWNFGLLSAGDLFMPRSVKFYALDYGVLHGKSQLSTAEMRQAVKEVGQHRPVVPVTWAQHDDGTYIGRPFTPYEQFDAKLKDCAASGFGIIHWMTRPLDLYFASLARQVWRESKDQPLKAACQEMAAQSFGQEAAEIMGEYLYRWVTEAPQFGRETSDRFIDRTLTDVDQVVAGCADRSKSIGQVKTATLTAGQRERVEYCRGMEQFIGDFYRAQDAYQKSQELLRTNDLAGARRAIEACDAGKVIEQFQKMAVLGGITRGEEGLIVSLNLRWLPHIVSLRQSLGLEPMRYRMSPTSHDPLAQSPGWATFHFEPDHRLWQCLGEKETGGYVFVLPETAVVQLPDGLRPALAEIGRSGVESDKALTIALGPIFTRDRRVRPGEYTLRMYTLDPSSTAAGQRVFDVSIGGSADAGVYRFEPVKARIDIYKEAGRADAMLVRSYAVEVGSSGRLSLTLTPVRGKAILCGVEVEAQQP